MIQRDSLKGRDIGGDCLHHVHNAFKKAGGDEVVSKHVLVIKLRLSMSEKEFASKHGFSALLVASGGSKVVIDEAVEVSAKVAGLKGIGHVSQR